MKTMQIKIAVLIGLLLVLIAGCGPVRTEIIKVHEGIWGLSMGFLKNSPPGEVYVGDIFPITIDLKNEGAYDIEDGIITLGVESEYITINTDEYREGPVRFSLLGRTIYDPTGGFDRKMIMAEARDLDPQSETHTTIVSVTACYPYKTEATAYVCIDTDIYGQKQVEKVCTPQTLSMGTIQREGQELPRGQGAPIAITKIEQKMLPHENEELIIPQFMIYVKNMGNGLPINVNVYENACKATGISKGSLNVAGANVYLSDRSVQLNCKPKLDPNSSQKTGYIKLEKGEDFLKCTLEEGLLKSMGTFTTPLMVEMAYGYTFTISQNLLIRKQI